MARHTLKIFRSSYRKILKYVRPFSNIMHESVKQIPFNLLVFSISTLNVYRSSRPEVFYKMVFLNISQNSQAWSATLLKKRLWHRYFSVNFAKFLITPFFMEHLWWLLRHIFIFVRVDFFV